MKKRGKKKMGFLGFGKKKDIPDELPDLISDEIEKESVMQINSALKETKEEAKEAPIESKSLVDTDITKVDLPSSNMKFVEDTPVSSSSGRRDLTTEEINRNKDVVNRLVKGVEETEERPMPVINNINKGFFQDLKSELMSEIKDINLIQKWYDKRFGEKGVVDNMKIYWNKQKEFEDLDSLAEEFKKRISVKVHELQNIERKWQTIYFDLIDKEEKIKFLERDLKKLLNEFVTICKKKKNSLAEEIESVDTKPESKKKRKKVKGTSVKSKAKNRK
jgi:hypothetical protein